MSWSTRSSRSSICDAGRCLAGHAQWQGGLATGPDPVGRRCLDAAFRSAAGAGEVRSGAAAGSGDSQLHASAGGRLCRRLCAAAVSAGLVGVAPSGMAGSARADAVAGAGRGGWLLSGGAAAAGRLLAAVQLSGHCLRRTGADPSAPAGRGSAAPGRGCSEVLVAHQVGQVGVGGLAAAQQYHHLADNLDQLGTGGLADLVDQQLLSLAITDSDPDLDPFVIVQSAVQLSQHGLGSTLFTDNDYRHEVVTDAFDGLLLFTAERNNNPMIPVDECQ